MDETGHKSFFQTHKVLAFLPLALMGAGVWYYVKGRVAADRTEPLAVGNEFARTAPARKAPPLPNLAPAYDPQLGLDIQGSEDFKSQITHALKLIWMADRDTFLFIKRNVSVIRNDNKTGFYMEDGKTVVALSSEQAFRSLTWCAGEIAHQAWHAWYALNYKKKVRKAPPPPGQADTSVPEANPAKLDYKGLDSILWIEAKAFEFQLDVLRKVGAPRSETDLLRRRAPRDFSAGHDGGFAPVP